MFTGLSTLRKAEKKEPTQQNKALQDYLKKYSDGPGADDDAAAEHKKKKKKKRPKPATGSGVAILDQDVTGFEHVPEAAPRPVAPLDTAGDDEDAPVIANPEEAEALKIQIEKSKNFYAKGQDGSGWVSAAAEAAERDRSRAAAAAAGRNGRKRSLSPEDMSPPRRGRQRHDSPDPAARAAAAAARGRRGGSPDLSPPRKGRQRHDSPPDMSPPRRGRDSPNAGGRTGRCSPPQDLLPPRRGTRQRHDSPPDASPPRRRQRHDSPPDASPPRRRQRHDSPEAAAAAAGRGTRGGSPDLSPPRRGRQRHDSPEPPAAAAAADSSRSRGRSPDLSPPRRRRHDSPGPAPGGDDDLSPPRRGRQRHDSPGPPPAAAAGRHPGRSPDLSPPRRGGPRQHQRHDSPPHASPPRRTTSGRGGPASPPAGAAGGAGGPPRMNDGTATGLVSSRQLAEETARLRAQAEERKRNAAGRGEATVYRDKVTGKAITAEEYADQVAKSKQKKAPREEINLAWKGGLAQQRAAMEAAQRAAEEAGKAFARGLDADVDVELKSRDRWGDPMAGKLKKNKGKDEFDLPPPVITEANKAMMEASGFSVPQEVPPHSWLRRGVPATINRYNIRPGRHWDGVDRSNGFEKEMFKMLNTRNAQALEARMWAQEDM